MDRTWTFGQKIGAGFAAMVAFALLIGAVAIYSLRTVVASKDRVIAVNARNLIDAEKLTILAESRGSAARLYLLTGEQKFSDEADVLGSSFAETLGRISSQVDADEDRRLLSAVERSGEEYHLAIKKVLGIKKQGGALETVVRRLQDEVLPTRETLDRRIEDFLARQERLLEDGKKAASTAASAAILWMVLTLLFSVVFAVFTAAALASTLSRQISAAVSQVQSSSSELQAAANQQATGAKEQATAMSEISTTINELLATSRQISDGAQRVAQISTQAASAAGGGDQAVGRASESIAGIKQQVDNIVGHMLALGKKSQQIGGVLEIINELAEQTNILSINATIEAAGAGEAGKRFSVVAEEIRKLADRVAGSTKEIRGLIEDIRSAVNTTVMATETGSKTVDAGARQFAEVAAAFRQIAQSVGVSNEAAKEIELSTKQQTSAVEQVNGAIANVAQASKETEASSAQTLQTATQLTGLSHELFRLVKAGANGR